MKLYTFPPSTNCRRADAVAKHLGLELDYVIVDLTKGEQRSPAYLAINPNGRVPTLQDGERTLWESQAIMGYLASKKDNELWPKTEARYDILRWMFWGSSHFGLACGGLVFENLIKGVVGQGAPDPAVVAKSTRDFRTHAAVLEQQLAGRKYVLGDELTLADFSLGASLTYAQPAKIPVAEFRNIVRWTDALNELPAWRDTAPKPQANAA